MHVREMFDLAGNVAIVTGASSGLGVWFSHGLAEAGAEVVLAARRADKLESVARELQSRGTRALPVPTDVTDVTEVQRLVEVSLSEFGRIDILVNNAGIGFDEEQPEAVSLDLVRQVFEVNFFAMATCCQLVGRVMMAQGSGRIINIASIMGVSADPFNPSAAYCASKGAVVGYTRELAHKWAPRGIKVFCLAPGFFPTDLTGPVFADDGVRRRLVAGIPLGRTGRADDIKGIAVFLASNASDLLIGHPIIADGGMILT